MRYKLLQFLLGKWFFGIYFAIGLAYFISFPMASTDISWPNSFVTTLGLMTGRDPYSFKASIENSRFFWSLAWIIHITSWLFIPALISLIVTNAADDIKKTERLKRSLGELLLETGIPSDNLDELVSQIQNDIERTMNESRKKGGIQ